MASSSRSIYFASVPDFKDLCSVTLQVDDQSSSGSTSSHSKYVGSKPQIIKCRELIFTEPGILASPSLQEEGYIYVVLEQSIWKSGRLQSRCQKMGLRVKQPMRVISAMFQACLAYTIKARLAPLWNKAGNWYLQGRDFLTNSGRIAAIDMELNVTEAEICLVLRPLMAKLRPCSLGDFDVCQPVLDQFYLSKDGVISEYSIDSKWCYILPSLKKGKVVSISHEIPDTSPFKTYKDIRRYWKNAYGYRLPECNDGMLYYNIYFPAIGPTLFTYPEQCIRKEEPILHGRVDGDPILNAFLTDLQYKMPMVCGAAFEVQSKAQYASTGLYPTSKEGANLAKMNLTSTPPPNSVHRIPTRPYGLSNTLTSTNRYLPAAAPCAPHPAVVPPPATLTYPVYGTVGNFNSTFNPAVHSSQQSIPQMTGVPDMALADGQFGAHVGYPNHLGTACRNVHQGVIPANVLGSLTMSFNPVMPEQNHHPTFNHTQTCYGSARAVTPSANPAYGIPAMTTMLNDNQLHMNQASMSQQPRIIPRFVAQRPRSSSNKQLLATSQKVIPKFVASKTSTARSQPPSSSAGVFRSSLVSSKTASRDRLTPGTGQPPVTSASERHHHHHHHGQAVTTNQASAPSFPRRDSSQVTKVPSVPKQTQLTLDAMVRRAPSTHTHRPTDKNSSKATKRKSQDEGSSVSKKPRAKPKVQEGIDIQSLAINDQLSKVNTLTLVTWLKDKGITVKAKDKKADLMMKVALYIQTNSMED